MNELVTINHAIQETQEVSWNMLDAFISFIDASPKTTQTYAGQLKQMMKYFSDNNITRPMRKDIISYREQLKAEGKKPTTIQNYMTAVKLFFRFLAQEGIYPNIADHVKGAKLSREHKKDYMTTAQVQAMLKGIDRTTYAGRRDYAVIALMVTCGLRTIEVVRANIEDLRTVGNSTVLFVQGKGKTEKAEFVKISSHVEQAIREYLKGRGNSEKEAPLFTSISNNSNGARMTTRSISRLVKEHMKGAGYDSERLTAHSLRHTAVTLSLLAGKDITEVQQFARHANITTTMIYNHALDIAKNTCSEAVANAIF